MRYRYADVSFAAKIGWSLLHNVAMSLGCVQYAAYESRGTGLRWDNFNEPFNASDPFTMAHVMTMLAVDCVLYILITWYVDNVRPGEYGVPRPLYFPFTVSVYSLRIQQEHVSFNHRFQPPL